MFKIHKSIEWVFYIYSYLKSEEFKNYINERLAGSTQKFISLSELRKLPINIPSKKQLEEYNNKVSPIFSTISLRTKENLNLTIFRDTFLPELMSIELDVSKLDIK